MKNADEIRTRRDVFERGSCFSTGGNVNRLVNDGFRYVVGKAIKVFKNAAYDFARLIFGPGYTDDDLSRFGPVRMRNTLGFLRSAVVSQWVLTGPQVSTTNRMSSLGSMVLVFSDLIG